MYQKLLTCYIECIIIRKKIIIIIYLKGGFCMVQPIRDKQQIEQMKTELKKNGTRDYMLFFIGINTGLRVGDILKLKVQDVKDRSHISIVEQKTDKNKRFFINENLKKEIDEYINSMKGDEYLFKSRKGTNKPISRVQAYRILNKAAVVLNMCEIGTHTMRKTFGFWHYKQFKDVAILQDIFNHASQSVTLKYIGITDDMKDETIKKFSL